MGRYFSVVVIAGVAVVLGGYLLMMKSEETAKLNVATERQAARRAFADRARMAAEENDSGTYLRAIQTALRSYDEDLKKRVYAKHPKWRDPGAYVKEIDTLLKEGSIKEEQHKSMHEGYETVRAAYDLMMAANWRPVLTAKGKGGTRLDIYSLKRVEDDQGHPILEGQFFFWGIEDSTQVSWGSLSMRFWKKALKTVRQGGRRTEVEEDIVLGKAEGDAQPRVIIQSPHKYVADFPSYVSMGTIWLPVMPHDAVAVDIDYGYTARIGGGSYDSVLSFEKLPIPEGWKLKPGESWDADVIEATEDEIRGVEPGAEEDAGARPR
ncbi:MAG: hypothetical protein H6729_07010 [Deltaproteobacteria bacterium]|nr:hypothetical protein [Deltaproteobacteria bacterium]